MKNLKSVLYGILFSITIFLGFTISVNAESVNDLTRLQEIFAEGGDIELAADFTNLETLIVPDGKTVTLDLNGHTLSAGLSQPNRHYYVIDNYGNFTLKDTNGGGLISGRGIENYPNGTMTILSGTIESIDTNGGAAIWNESTLNISGGTFRTTHVGSVSDTYGAGCLNNSGTATITGGTFQSVNKRTYAVISSGDITISGNTTVTGAHGALAIDGGNANVNGGSYTSTEYYGLYISNDAGSNADVTVNGGTFTGNTTSVLLGSDVNSPVNSKLTINNGTFNNKIVAQTNASAEAITIKGGTFNDEIEDKDTTNNDAIVIMGGTFEVEPEDAYPAEGYKKIEDNNGNYKVVKIRKVYVYHEDNNNLSTRFKTETIEVGETENYNTNAINQTNGLPEGYRYVTVYGNANGTMGNSNVYVYYRYSNRYDLNFANTDLSKASIAYNTTVDLSQYEPTRDGYAFVAWYSDEDLSNKITEITITDDTTIYAKWLKVGKVHVFHEDNNNISHRLTNPQDNIMYVNEGENYEALALTADTGLPEGYYYVTVYGPASGTMGSSDVYVYFRYSNRYDLNFANTDLESQKYEYNSTVNLEQFEPTKEGFSFGGWYSDENLNNEITEVTITEDTTIYAKWIRVGKVHVVHEDNNELSHRLTEPQDNVMEVNEGEDYEALALTADTGLPEGYYYVTVYGPASGTMGSEDVYVYFRYSNVYTLDYVNTHDDNLDTETYVYGTTVTLPENLDTRNYHIFNGWVDEEGNPVTEVTMNDNRTVTATWLRAGVAHIEYVDEEGNPIADAQDIKVEANTRQGFDPVSVEGYYLVETRGNARNHRYIYGQTYNITFVYSNKYTLTKVVDGEESTETVTYGDVITLDPLENEEYRDFAGWVDEENTPVTEITIDGDTTVTATWTLYGKVTVHYIDTNTGEDLVDPVEHTGEAGSNYFFFARNFARIRDLRHYRLVSANILNGQYEYGENQDIYFEYSDYYDLVYLNSYDDTLVTESHKYGTEVELKTPAERVGYIFEGWYTGFLYLSGPHTTITIDDETNYVYARWTRAGVAHVSYIDEETGESIIDDSYINVRPLTAPTIEPLDIEGYYLVDTTGRTSGYIYLPGFTNNITFTYSNDYTVEFKDADMESQVVDYNTVLDLTEMIPEKEGYTFLGWYDENGQKVTEITVLENRTLTAKWEENVGDVEFEGEVIPTAASNQIVQNPKTGDDINESVAMLLASLFGLGLVCKKKFVKNN